MIPSALSVETESCLEYHPILRMFEEKWRAIVSTSAGVSLATPWVETYSNAMLDAATLKRRMADPLAA